MRHFTWTRRCSIVLLAAGLALPLAACGDDDDAGTTGTTAADQGEGGAYDTTAGGGGGGSDSGATLTIEGFAFSDVTASAGDTVTVANNDGTTHTVTSDDGAWEELRIDGDSEGEITAPSEPGSYDFHCAIHSTMTGTLVVE